MLEIIINSKTNPSPVTNIPARSSEHLLFASQQDSSDEQIRWVPLQCSWC